MDAARRIRNEDDAPAAEPMRVQRRERAKPSREDLSVRRRLERSQESSRVRTAALQCLACGCRGRGAAQGSCCPSCGSLAVTAMPARSGAVPDNFHYTIHSMGRSDGREGWKHKRLYGFLKGENDDAPVGHINFHVNPHGTALAVEDMETHAEDEGKNFRGRGVASAMQDAMVKEHPGHFIDHGMRTPAGSMWWEKYDDPAPERNIENLHPNLWEEHFDPENKHPTSRPAPTPEEEKDERKRWDELYKKQPYRESEIASPFAIQLPRETHDRLMSSDVPTADRAKELLRHISNGQPKGIKWGREGHQGNLAAYTGRMMQGRLEGHDVIHGILTAKTPEGANTYDAQHGFERHRNKQLSQVEWQSGTQTGYYDRRDHHKHEFGDDGPTMRRTSTRLPTQIERANPGDRMRTPQGQEVEIKKVRPHETENDKVYVDTDMGTSIMSRGTDVELVPHNSQQRELPGSGSPTGNVGQLPGSGRGAGGEGMTGKAPHCPVDGSRMVFRDDTWICPVDGTTAPTGAAPEGMAPVDWGRGNIVDRQRNRGVPQTHMWANKYNTVDRPPMAIHIAERVLSTTMEGNRS